MQLKEEGGCLPPSTACALLGRIERLAGKAIDYRIIAPTSEFRIPTSCRRDFDESRRRFRQVGKGDRSAGLAAEHLLHLTHPYRGEDVAGRGRNRTRCSYPARGCPPPCRNSTDHSRSPWDALGEPGNAEEESRQRNARRWIDQCLAIGRAENERIAPLAHR